MNTVNWFRYIALFEGVSWLLLLFVAMPMKYIGGDPIPVKIVGMTHGILFIGLCALAVAAVQTAGLSRATALRVFIASFIPFGTFFTDRRLKTAEVKA